MKFCLAIALVVVTATTDGFITAAAPPSRVPFVTTTMQAALKAPLTQADYRAKLCTNSNIQSQNVATLPRPGTSSPSSIKFYTTNDESDDKWITYLAPDSSDAKSLTRKLWATNVATGETKELLQPGETGQESDFSLEEKLRRERARLMTTGVTSYATSSSSGKMLVPLGGALMVLDSISDTTPPRKLVSAGDDGLPSAGAPLLDAKLSSDGSTVAFVCDNEVYVMSSSSASDNNNTPIQITTGARGLNGITNGVADYVAQEELDRPDGFWLSPSGTSLVFEQVDESHIPAYRITHQGEDKGLSPTLTDSMSTADVQKESTVTHEEHRYPFAGAQNPKVKLGVVSTTAAAASDNDVIWFDLEQVFGDDFYLAKVEWLKNNDNDDESTKIVVQLMDRRQQNLALLLLDAVTGTVTTLHVETAMDGAWINLNDAFRMISSDNKSMQFLWASERDGYRHLYVLEASLKEKTAAKVVRRLTGPGEFIVEQVVEMDDTHVYYMGTAAEQWLEGHLFRVALNGNDPPTCLTGSVPGQHSCVVNIKAGLFVDTVSTVDQAPIVTIHKLPSLDEKSDTMPAEPLLQLHDAAKQDDRVAALNLKAPTFHTFPSTDGKVTLQAAVYLPDETIHGKGPYPLVVATYGGPHVQYVQNTWGMMTADMRSQFLRANGFAVIKVDNRGSFRRGLVFEAPVYGNMGELEVADQVAGVEWAVGEGIADKDRVAVSGWSYGGYMALKCLAGRPDVFHAAVAGAPVTDWTLYDTAYTERYMGLPQENPEGYAKSSALAQVENIEGSLLLCHGLLDENVLFRHSAVLANALIKNKKAYDLALFPSERHGPRRPQDRAFLEERILAFLQRSLGL